MAKTKKVDARTGLRDIWNAFMVEGCEFTDSGFPSCPNTTEDIPESIITYEEAVAIYNKEMREGNINFHNKAFVGCFLDDYKFDSRNGIWHNWKRAKDILEHFEGIISPDFSTYLDFPDPLKRYNTYRMRAWGYWWGKLGHKVINNVRGDFLCLDYCFEGIPKNSIVCIGTVASELRRKENQILFEEWILKMYEELHPHTILTYGSAQLPVFKKLKKKGVIIVEYPSKTCLYFKTRKAK